MATVDRVGVGQAPVDARSELLAAAKAGDSDFPDGEHVVLTHFSHVGQVTTKAGETIFVVDRRAVLAGTLAPRGQNAILFFSGDFRYLGQLKYVHSRPLWCEGSRLFLSGNLDGFFNPVKGNAIDLSDGFANLKGHRNSAYGSSVGIEN
ncbi:MAG: hypothetical protein H8E20_01250 [Verrucomicrobia bacterium]|nr:hypothetical protein [Verrucomicrobiota bacterium]